MTPVDRFRALLRIPTISRVDETEVVWEHFDRFVAEVPRLYPGMDAALELELVSGHSLLYRWPGTGDGARAPYGIANDLAIPARNAGA